MKTITPEQMAKSGSEDSHQKAIMQWCALNLNKYPELKWLHHSPNGGFRNVREAAKLKAMGVKPGFPDLILLVPRSNYHGLTIELKRLSSKTKKDGGAEPAQIEWKNHLNSSGYYATVCHGWLEAVNVIEHYLKLGK